MNKSNFNHSFEKALRKKWGDQIRISIETLSDYTDDFMCVIWRDGEQMSFSGIVKGTDSDIHCDDARLKLEVSDIISKCLGENSLKPLREIKVGAPYRHFKGGIYRVLADAKHTEQMNLNGEHDRLVCYENVEDGSCWVRPREMFMDGRFQLYESSQD